MMHVAIQKAAQLLRRVVNRPPSTSASTTSWISSHHQRYTQRIDLVSRTYATNSGRTRSTKRVGKWRPESQSGGWGICAAYHLDDTIRLSTVPKVLSTLDTNSQLMSTKMVSTTDVTHSELTIRERGQVHEAHVFIFSSGAVVFWHVPRSIRKRILNLLKPNLTMQAPRVKMKEFDHEFGIIIKDEEKAPKFDNDQIIITNRTTIRELLAISYGLAQSVELVILEVLIDKLVLKTKSLPEKFSKIGLNDNTITSLISELLSAKYQLSLISDIWDVPEFFWTNSDIEFLYTDASNAVELHQRTNILNARVSVIHDALDIVNGEIRARASIRVERAILALIAVEVVLELAKLSFT